MCLDKHKHAVQSGRKKQTQEARMTLAAKRKWEKRPEHPPEDARAIHISRKQRVASQLLLRKVVRVLDVLNIEYTIIGGTLIGMLWGCGLLHHDDDIDMMTKVDVFDRMQREDAQKILRRHCLLFRPCDQIIGNLKLPGSKSRRWCLVNGVSMNIREWPFVEFFSVQPEFNLGNVRIKGLELPYRDLDWDQISPRNFPGLDAKVPAFKVAMPSQATIKLLVDLLYQGARHVKSVTYWHLPSRKWGKTITEETTWDRDTKKLIVPQRTYAPSSLFYSLSPVAS